MPKFRAYISRVYQVDFEAEDLDDAEEVAQQLADTHVYDFITDSDVEVEEVVRPGVISAEVA